MEIATDLLKPSDRERDVTPQCLGYRIPN
jgi:hypothetical protein